MYNQTERLSWSCHLKEMVSTSLYSLFRLHKPLFAGKHVRLGPWGTKHPVSGPPAIVGGGPEGHPGARDAAQIDEWRIIGTGDLSHSVHHTN